ncbi:hypothetical protein [Oricola sp.]|uniref:DUF7507 domain-containing protein n=1 Tax=Oricola sp. TaxID=1979950 RepID=UPI003515BA86
MKRNTGNGAKGKMLSAAGGATGTLALALVLTGAPIAPAFAQLQSTVTATGKAGDADVQAQGTESTDLAEPLPSLTASQRLDLDVSKGRDSEHADEGDDVSVTVTVTNDGNFPVSRVVVDGASLTIGGDTVELEPAAFDPPSADMKAGDTVTFTATRPLTAEQVFRAVAAGDGIIVNAGVAGTAKGDQVTASVEPGNLLVAANPQLAIGTNSVLEKAEGNEGEGAETGDTITYKYTVENVGNVSVADVAVTVDLAGKTLQSQGTPDLGVDPFEVTVSANDPLGLNEDDPETAGVYDMLGPGGAVEFTHAHVVTQEEFEAQ